MEVLRDHSAAESVRTSAIGALTIASRFVVFTGLSLMEARAEAPMATTDRQSAIVMAETTPKRSSAASVVATAGIETLDGQSLLDRDIGIERAIGEDLHVHIRRVREDVLLCVNGKVYAPPAKFRLGEKIDTVTLRAAIVELFSKQHGTAEIERAEIERILSVLAMSDAPVVRATVAVQIQPKGAIGTVAMALSNWWNDTDAARPQSVEVVFERRNPEPSIFAMVEAQ